VTAPCIQMRTPITASVRHRPAGRLQEREVRTPLQQGSALRVVRQGTLALSGTSLDRHCGVLTDGAGDVVIGWRRIWRKLGEPKFAGGRRSAAQGAGRA